MKKRSVRSVDFIARSFGPWLTKDTLPMVIASDVQAASAQAGRELCRGFGRFETYCHPAVPNRSLGNLPSKHDRFYESLQRCKFVET